MEAVVKRFKTDLHNCVGFIQEPKKLKENVKSLYEKYVQDETVSGWKYSVECNNQCLMYIRNKRKNISLKPQSATVLHGRCHIRDVAQYTHYHLLIFFLWYNLNNTHRLSERVIPVAFRAGYSKMLSVRRERISLIYRAVFIWLSKNQFQSNYSRQSQKKQTVRWTNQKSMQFSVTCAKEKSRVQGAIGFGFASHVL